MNGTRDVGRNNYTRVRVLEETPVLVLFGTLHTDVIAERKRDAGRNTPWGARGRHDPPKPGGRGVYHLVGEDVKAAAIPEVVLYGNMTAPDVPIGGVEVALVPVDGADSDGERYPERKVHRLGEF